MGNLLKVFTGKFDINIGKFSLPVSFAQAALVIFLIFLLVLVLAQFRRHFVNWSVKGALFGIFFGFLLALILEGFLIVGGRTVITGVLGWKNAPKPISVALDSGRNKLIDVLGVETTIPTSSAKENTTIETAVETLQSLNPSDMKKVKSLICQP